MRYQNRSDLQPSMEKFVFFTDSDRNQFNNEVQSPLHISLACPKQAAASELSLSILEYETDSLVARPGQLCLGINLWFE